MTTIRDTLDEHGIPHSEGRSGWIQTTCPDCGDVSSKGGSKFYLGISTSTGASNCWRCGRKSTARVLATLTNLPIKEILKQLDNLTFDAAPIRKKGRLALPGGRGPLLPGHVGYLHTRGFDPTMITDFWGVEGIGQTHWLAWRLFIPIHYHGKVVSWTTRSVKTHERLRYISASLEDEAVPHKSILYGADFARHAIIIHEGPLDVWATGPGAVATCGTSVTEAQIHEMIHYPVRVVCFDNEPEAQARAKALANMLSVYPGITHNVVLETGNDAADADQAEIAELRTAFLE